ncbi:MAG TPA: hypothetical protein VNN08_15430 [Thermoanaerobaculia bacterium]|nr:hypothetical protein [Thermoanaerobaculia bacterium]
MATNNSGPTNAVAATSADIVTAIRATALAPADRVDILRALRETMPDIVPPDPQQNSRIRVAAGLPRQFVDAAINGLTASSVWERSASTSAAEVAAHRDFDEQRPVFDELKTFTGILDYSLRYHHWQATLKSRTAYRVGKTLGGDEGLILQPHIEIMAATLPRNKRKSKTPPAPAPTTPPKPAA